MLALAATPSTLLLDWEYIAAKTKPVYIESGIRDQHKSVTANRVTSAMLVTPVGNALRPYNTASQAH
jgi:hypothetical protein